MLAFLQLTRFSNLLIIILTQYTIRLFLIQPILNFSGMNLQMGDLEFALMVLATVLISAGGYTINDYFDVRIDTINKPEQTVIDRDIKRRSAMAAHAIMSSIGVLIGIYISWRSNVLISGSALFALAAMALWFYSVTFKAQFLVGNIVVSFLTAMIPFMVALFEIPRVIIEYNGILVDQQTTMHTTVIDTILTWAGAYTLAAFLLSLIREIIKDMEDVEGDSQYECRTLPIVVGIQYTKWIITGLISLCIFGIGYVQYIQYSTHNLISFFYFLLVIQLPLIILLFLVNSAHEKRQYHRASMLVKAVMLMGIFYLIFSRFVPTL